MVLHGPVCIIQFVYTGDVYAGYRALEQINCPRWRTAGSPRQTRSDMTHLARCSCIQMTHTVNDSLRLLVSSQSIADSYVNLPARIGSFQPAGHYYERSFIARSTPPKLCQSLLTSFQELLSGPGVSGSVIAMSVYGADSALTDFIGNGAILRGSEGRARGGSS